MTSLASPTKFTVVRIILQMTALAVIRHIHFFLDRVPMAGITNNTFMLSGQLKFSLLIVIKFPRFPIANVMAQIAISA
jgi:hypothetical protein